jgi:hypothetical protein
MQEIQAQDIELGVKFLKLSQIMKIELQDLQIASQ